MTNKNAVESVVKNFEEMAEDIRATLIVFDLNIFIVGIV